MATIEQLGKKMMETLNSILTGGDARVPAPVNNKISWCQPGIPFMPEDFQFAAEGLGAEADAEHLKKMLKQAFNFSLAVDFVPDVSGTYAGDQQQTVYRTSEARMSHMYGEILRFSKVVQSELTADEKAKLDKFRGLLYQTKTVKSLTTDEETQVSVPSPLMKAYTNAMSDYIDAATNFRSKQVQSLAAVGPAGAAAVADFALNADNYVLKVKAAADRWTTEGYRNDVDAMNAYINGVTQRSMALWKQHLLELYERGTLTDTDSASPFKYTTIIPGDFASANGWTSYEFHHEQANSASSWSTSAWNGGGGLNLGLWRASGGAQGKTESSQSNLNINNFKISFDLVQAVVARPWFYPEFFINRGWTLRKGEGWTFDQYPSDGGAVPQGNFIGYPTQAIFVRNLVIESDEFATAFSQHASSVSGGGSVGWGPFSVHGSYSHASGGQNYSMDRQGGKITVPGMQIIGFINHLIPKAPNPLDGIPPEQFQ